MTTDKLMQITKGISFQALRFSRFLLALAVAMASLLAGASAASQTTYCNPINIDYGYCPIPNFAEWGKHRSTADPVIITYKGDYYLFSTNQWGYWWSSDMLNWNFISRRFLKPYHKVYDDLCAPAACVMGDTMLVFGSTYTSDFPIWMSTDPKANVWKEAIDSLE